MHRYADIGMHHNRQNSAAIYRQYLFINAATPLFCMECSETQVATSSLIDYRKFSVLFVSAPPVGA